MSDPRSRHPQYEQAKAAAVRLLAGRGRTRAELQRRLQSRGLAPEAVEQAIGDLQQAGYIDDEQYARDRIEALLRQSKRGIEALRQALAGDGLPAELAERVIAEQLEGAQMGEWAREVARERARRLQGMEREAARRRLYGYLRRRGFSDEEARGACDEALPAIDEHY
ncbi:MAG: regulatory protein RecX [Armatimonadota bacterium]